MANQLKVDTAQMQKTARDYSSAAQELKKARDNLEKAIEALRCSGWKSGASKAYFKLYDEKWKKSMETHIVTLEHLRKQLEEAKKEYETLCSQATSLGSSLV